VLSHQGTQGWYKKITECGFARPRTPADQEQQHHTSNITTPTISPQQRPHHSTLIAIAVLMEMIDQLGTPREGVMSTAASIPLVRNQGL
jgi:hypothetical protein